jgi:hypothetical protein
MFRSGLLLASGLLLSGCLHVKMDVYAKVDVNVKMEQAVTDVLADIYGDSTTVNTRALPAPAAGDGAR